MPIVSARRSVATRSKTEAHQINYHPILRYDIIYRFYEFMSIYHNRLVIFLLYSRPKIGYDLITQQPEVYFAQCNDSDHFYAKDESLAPMTIAAKLLKSFGNIPIKHCLGCILEIYLLRGGVHH